MIILLLLSNEYYLYYYRYIFIITDTNNAKIGAIKIISSVSSDTISSLLKTLLR